MKRILFPFALIIILVQSCQSPGQKNALDYNNKIANISKINKDKWKEVGIEISAAGESHEFSKLIKLANDLIDFLENKISEVNAMENPAGSEDLKNAMLEFLKFQKRTADETLTPYTQMNHETTSEEFQSATLALVEAAKNEEHYLVKLQDAQRDFAKKNGFKLQENKEQ
jgi:hypothetical protein